MASGISMMSPLPVIDVAALVDPAASDAAQAAVADELDAACRRYGFFYATGHGVDPALIDRLVRVAREFFAQDEPAKLRFPMSAAGRAWRGYFPAGGELTSNRPDWKEGLYLGSELGPDHPRVKAGVILHGANLWPEVPGLRTTILEYMDSMTRLGHALIGGIALGLGLPRNWFADHGTADPLILLRLFNYPSRPVPPGTDAQWGVGEHTDYGLLTMLWRTRNSGPYCLNSSAPCPGGCVPCCLRQFAHQRPAARTRQIPILRKRCGPAPTQGRPLALTVRHARPGAGRLCRGAHG